MYLQGEIESDANRIKKSLREQFSEKQSKFDDSSSVKQPRMVVKGSLY